MRQVFRSRRSITLNLSHPLQSPYLPVQKILLPLFLYIPMPLPRKRPRLPPLRVLIALAPRRDIIYMANHEKLVSSKFSEFTTVEEISWQATRAVNTRSC